jgi:hypothetical protein
MSISEKEHKRMLRISFLEWQIANLLENTTALELKGLTQDEAVAALLGMAQSVFQQRWRKKR